MRSGRAIGWYLGAALAAWLSAGSAQAELLPSWWAPPTEDTSPPLPSLDALFTREAPAPSFAFHWAEIDPPEPTTDGPPDAWSALGFRQGDDRRQRTSRQVTAHGMRVDTTVSVDDPSAGTADGRTWQTEESMRMEVLGPLFVFGQADASSQSIERQRLRMFGKTGVGVRWQPWTRAEVQVRGGPVLSYADAGGTPEEEARLALELTAKAPLFAGLKVEYSGTALPAMSALVREQLSQDVRLALSLSERSQFHVGTRYNWTDPGTAATEAARAPWTDRMQLYLGLQLKR